jgi:hypothetical protein
MHSAGSDQIVYRLLGSGLPILTGINPSPSWVLLGHGSLGISGVRDRPAMAIKVRRLVIGVWGITCSGAILSANVEAVIFNVGRACRQTALCLGYDQHSVLYSSFGTNDGIRPLPSQTPRFFYQLFFTLPEYQLQALCSSHSMHRFSKTLSVDFLSMHSGCLPR